jgi:hypothetical protein
MGCVHTRHRCVIDKITQPFTCLIGGMMVSALRTDRAPGRTSNMAYAFTTKSGALYKLENGRISRMAESKVYDRSLGRMIEVPIVDEPCTFSSPPTPGSYFAFSIKSEAHLFHGGKTVTSVVQHIYPIVHMEMVEHLPTEEELAQV